MIQRFLNGFDKQVPDGITVSEKQLELFREEL
jgi:hypothetical protein